MPNPHFSFDVLKSSSNSSARAGLFKTPHGEIKTPILCPLEQIALLKC